MSDYIKQAGWVSALNRVLLSWEKTPYSNGQALKGVAADCIGFIAAVMDELNGQVKPPPQRLATDAAWHKHPDTDALTLRIADRWPHERFKPGEKPVESGDVLMARVGKGNVGHVYIVGTDTRQAWHASQGSGVCWTSTASVMPAVAIVWRANGRENWK